MIKDYTYSQNKVWNSVLNVSKKISNITDYLIDEDLKLMGENLDQNAQRLQNQLMEEIEEEYIKTFSGYNKSLSMVESMEKDLIEAYDQGYITERELKITLEAITIYRQAIKSHISQNPEGHKLHQYLKNNVKY